MKTLLRKVTFQSLLMNAIVVIARIDHCAVSYKQHVLLLDVILQRNA